MKKNYKIIAYVVYTICLIYMYLRIANVGGVAFDLAYFSNNIYYLILLGVFSSFILFQYGTYEVYLKKYASYYLIRYKAFNQIYNSFVINGFIQSIILTVIKVLIDIYVFDLINIMDIVVYFLVLLCLILTHINFEITFNSKTALFTVLSYFAISFSVADLLVENDFGIFVCCFIPNFLLPSRVENVIISVGILMFVIVFNYLIGKTIFKRKDII